VCIILVIIDGFSLSHNRMVSNDDERQFICVPTLENINAKYFFVLFTNMSHSNVKKTMDPRTFLSHRPKPCPSIQITDVAWLYLKLWPEKTSLD